VLRARGRSPSGWPSERTVVAQFIAESVVLAAAGAAARLLFAAWCLQALIGFHPAGLPRLDEIRLDAPVLVFTMTVSVAATLVFGTVSGIVAPRRDADGI
jgi:putative ABC transport system permease protein